MGDATAPDVANGRTVLGYPLPQRWGILVGIPVMGLLVSLVLPAVARWAVGLGVPLPLGIVFRALAAVDNPREIGLALLTGLLIGLGIAFAAIREAAAVTLSATSVRVDRDDQTHTFARADIGAVFIDGGRLVLLDNGSRQLASERHQASVPALAQAFTRYGYPWYGADPFAELFRPWVRGTGELPESVDAVLAARESALRRKAATEAAHLRASVQNLGFTIRDEGTAQYWRPLVRS